MTARKAPPEIQKKPRPKPGQMEAKMSCKDCEEFQESDSHYYFRWGIANIDIRACEKHAAEVMDVLRDAQAKTARRRSS